MPSDPRAAQARDHQHRQQEADQQAKLHREQRDRLVRLLRAENPDRWTYTALARAVDCSPELIAAICKGRTRRTSRGES